MLSVDHGVFSTHVVDRDWAVGRGMDRRHHIEVGQGRLDHEEVRALGFVQLCFHHGFFDRRSWVHLVAPSVTGARRGACCVAEGSVEGRGVLDGVGQHPSAVMSSIFQSGADGPDASVHHVGCTDVICPGLGGQDGHLSEGCHRFVVEDGTASHVAAVTVICDRAHADVGHQNHGIAVVIAKGLQCPKHRPVVVQPKRPSGSLSDSG